MNDPVVIEPLSSLWLTGIAVSIIISVMIVQVGVRIPPDKRRILMLFVGLFILGIETWQQFYFSHLGVWTVEKSLPIHLCGISAIIAGIMMIKANQNGFEFLALIGSPGALHAILTPQLNHGYDIFLVYKYYCCSADIENIFSTAQRKILYTSSTITIPMPCRRCSKM